MTILCIPLAKVSGPDRGVCRFVGVFMKITKLNGHFFSFLGFHAVVLSKATKTNRMKICFLNFLIVETFLQLHHIHMHIHVVLAKFVQPPPTHFHLSYTHPLGKK